jgi:hypothetical protein
MEQHTCDSCGVNIPEGGLYYNCRTEIVSGFDNLIPDSQLKDPDALIRDACKALSGREQKEVAAEVYEEISFVVCPACRTMLRKQLLAMKLNGDTSGKVLLFPPKDPT